MNIIQKKKKKKKKKKICERAFKRPQDLKKHKIVHEEDRTKLQDLKSSYFNNYIYSILIFYHIIVIN